MAACFCLCLVFLLLVFPHGSKTRKWGEHEYFLSTHKKSYSGAISTCSSVSGRTIASILSQEENNYAKNTFREAWIGLTTSVSDCSACSNGEDNKPEECAACRANWRWLDGSPMNYTNWEPTEPTGGTICARMRDTGKWADSNSCANSDKPYKVLCKRHLCSITNCGNNGTCSAADGNARCECDPGFHGVPCVDINECAESPCVNGQCANSAGSFTCRCDEGFTGHLCGTDINECASGPCTNGATCVNNNGSFRCDCLPGYTGAVCETDIDDCEAVACNGSGQCRDGVAQYTCECFQGFQGPSCEEDVNECDSNPCQHRGLCQNTRGSFHCDCLLGYTGNLCETDVDDCVDVSCNNGTCVDGQATFTCDCFDGFQGTSCADRIISNENVAAPTDKGKTNKMSDTQIAFYVALSVCILSIAVLLFLMFTDNTLRAKFRNRFSAGKKREIQNLDEIPPTSLQR